MMKTMRQNTKHTQALYECLGGNDDVQFEAKSKIVADDEQRERFILASAERTKS